MLDNFEQYQNANLQHIDNVHQQLARTPENEQRAIDEQSTRDIPAGMLK
jgi:hypothetical protein